MYYDTAAVAGAGFLGGLCVIFGNDTPTQIFGAVLIVAAIVGGPFLIRREMRRRS